MRPEGDRVAIMIAERSAAERGDVRAESANATLMSDARDRWRAAISARDETRSPRERFSHWTPLYKTPGLEKGPTGQVSPSCYGTGSLEKSGRTGRRTRN